MDNKVDIALFDLGGVLYDIDKDKFENNIRNSQ